MSTKVISPIFNSSRCINKTLSLRLFQSLGTCCSGNSFDCAARIQWLRCFTISADSWGERLVSRDHKTIKVLCLNDWLLCDFAGSALKLGNS